MFWQSYRQFQQTCVWAWMRVLTRGSWTPVLRAHMHLLTCRPMATRSPALPWTLHRAAALRSRQRASCSRLSGKRPVRSNACSGS